ncbi:MAG TPA: hypothetical protein VLA13_05760 [Massilibacterium sp.]|nr:hypothetical protein [Massilibacterium sp.]
MKTHKFDVEDAKKYGVEKAILLEHLKFHQEANHGNDDMIIDGKVHAFIKPKTIKEMYPYMNYASVRRWLKELEEDGVIESCKPKARGGYHLKYYHVKGYKIPNDQNDQSNVQSNQSLNDQNDQSSNTTNVKRPNDKYTDDFEKFWDLYDKKKGKRKAWQKWKKLSESDIQQIFENVPTFLTHFSSKQYVPYPRKYLHNRYWEDEEFQEPQLNHKTNGQSKENRAERFWRIGEELFDEDGAADA